MKTTWNFECTLWILFHTLIHKISQSYVIWAGRRCSILKKKYLSCNLLNPWRHIYTTSDNRAALKESQFYEVFKERIAIRLCICILCYARVLEFACFVQCFWVSAMCPLVHAVVRNIYLIEYVWPDNLLHTIVFRVPSFNLRLLYLFLPVWSVDRTLGPCCS